MSSPRINGHLLVLLIAATSGGGCAHSGIQTDAVTWRLDNLTEVAGHRLTVLGEPTLIETSAGSALEFDGVDDAIFLDVHPLAGMANFTAEVIFQPYADGAREQRFFHMQEDGSESRILFETRLVDGDRWFLDTYIRSGEQSAVLYAEDDTHPTGQWHHAAIVVDGENMRHFVNGREELSSELKFRAQAPGRTSLGVRINEVHWFKGAIRIARFTPRALSPADFLSADD